MRNLLDLKNNRFDAGEKRKSEQMQSYDVEKIMKEIENKNDMRKVLITDLYLSGFYDEKITGSRRSHIFENDGYFQTVGFTYDPEVFDFFKILLKNKNNYCKEIVKMNKLPNDTFSSYEYFSKFFQDYKNKIRESILACMRITIVQRPRIDDSHACDFLRMCVFVKSGIFKDFLSVTDRFKDLNVVRDNEHLDELLLGIPSSDLDKVVFMLDRIKTSQTTKKFFFHLYHLGNEMIAQEKIKRISDFYKSNADFRKLIYAPDVDIKKMYGTITITGKKEKSYDDRKGTVVFFYFVTTEKYLEFRSKPQVSKFPEVPENPPETLNEALNDSSLTNIILKDSSSEIQKLFPGNSFLKSFQNDRIIEVTNKKHRPPFDLLKKYQNQETSDELEVIPDRTVLGIDFFEIPTKDALSGLYYFQSDYVGKPVYRPALVDKHTGELLWMCSRDFTVERKYINSVAPKTKKIGTLTYQSVPTQCPLGLPGDLIEFEGNQYRAKFVAVEDDFFKIICEMKNITKPLPENTRLFMSLKGDIYLETTSSITSSVTMDVSGNVITIDDEEESEKKPEIFDLTSKMK